jgi:nucleoid DNA-binding protein
MRKDELVEQTLNNLSKSGMNVESRQLARIVQTFLSTIKEVLINGQHIEIRGFGTFSVRDRSNRTAWNPIIKQTFKVEGKKVPYFKPGTIFKKEILNGKLMSDEDTVVPPPSPST